MEILEYPSSFYEEVLAKAIKVDIISPEEHYDIIM